VANMPKEMLWIICWVFIDDDIISIEYITDQNSVGSLNAF